MATPRKRKASKSTSKCPLWLHSGTGQWAKKIRGRMVYFGTDLQAALSQYEAEKASWQAGVNPREQGGSYADPTVADVCNEYLASQEQRLLVGELAPRTFQEQTATCKLMTEHFGRQRRVTTLKPADFATFRATLAAKYAPTKLANEIVRVRTVFKWAFENEITEANVRYGSGFSKPKKETLRRHTNKRNRELQALSPAELRTLLDSAPQPMRTFILLGLNCGYGAADIATLPQAIGPNAIDLDGGWITHERAKTAVHRRCPLWPETVAALRESLQMRPKPHSRHEDDLAFLTRFGRRWVRTNSKGTPNDELGKAFAKLLRANGMKRAGVGFYHLRHVVQTIGEQTGDLPAVAAIMGHTDQTMAANYRLDVDDARLQAVTDRLHEWLYADADEDEDGEQPDTIPFPSAG